MSSEAPIISFVLPVRNAERYLRRCLESIAAASRGVRTEILVADNGSSDASGDIARGAGARVMRLPGLRVAEVRNRAVAAARGQYIAFIDADHELAPGWAESALAAMQNEDVWAAGAQYHAPPDGTWVQRTYDWFRQHPCGTTETDWLPSGNLLIRRDAFAALGGFDTSLETCEDVDLCERLRAAGGRLIASDRLRSVHQGDPSTLRALFWGELWRGRDNLRVSLRGPWQLRALPSMLIPVANLAAIAAAAVGLMTWPLGGWRVALPAVALFALVVCARSVVLLRRREDTKFGMVAAAQAFAVAGVYDAARAIALVAHGSHDRRRG
jgi:GT2 family glycosyltransferase